MYLANCPNQNSPTISTDEPKSKRDISSPNKNITQYELPKPASKSAQKQRSHNTDCNVDSAIITYQFKFV